MDTTQGVGSRAPSTEEVLEGLNDLLQLDHDAVGAYDIAIEKLQDRDHAQQISGFKADHERHIRELNQLIAELGGTPQNEPHMTGPFKEALQSLGALAGDKGVLLAWRTNELQVRTKYDSYAAKAVFWPDNAKRLIDRNALDEERHYQWVVDVLQRMGLASGEDWESDVATKLREAGTRVEHLGHEAKARAGEIADAARERVGEVTDAARERASDVADAARERAADAAATVRDSVAHAGATARNRVADGLETAAHRLEDVAERQGTTGTVGSATHRVAEGMEGTADYVRRASVRNIQHDLEEMARRSPIQTLGVLFIAGFVIGRILR